VPKQALKPSIERRSDQATSKRRSQHASFRAIEVSSIEASIKGQSFKASERLAPSKQAVPQQTSKPSIECRSVEATKQPASEEG